MTKLADDEVFQTELHRQLEILAKPAEPKLRESWGSMAQDVPTVPAWSPVPLQRAREFVRKNPTAQIDMLFPTVYEENRSEKMQDLATAQEEKVITHRRMAEEIAKELGFEQYNYDTELAAITAEQDNALIQPAPPVAPGMGGPGASLFDPLSARLGAPAAVETPSSRNAGGLRGEPGQDFRGDQKSLAESERLVSVVVEAVRGLNDGIKELSRAREVEIRPKVRSITRDRHGRIESIEERPAS